VNIGANKAISAPPVFAFIRRYSHHSPHFSLRFARLTKRQTKRFQPRRYSHPSAGFRIHPPVFAAFAARLSSLRSPHLSSADPPTRISLTRASIQGVKTIEFRADGSNKIYHESAALDAAAFPGLGLGDSDRKIAVFVLDCRTHKDAWPVGLDMSHKAGLGLDFLGEAQWAWFEKALNASDARVNIIVNGLQVNSRNRIPNVSSLPSTCDDKYTGIGEWVQIVKPATLLPKPRTNPIPAGQHCGGLGEVPRRAAPTLRYDPRVRRARAPDGQRRRAHGAAHARRLLLVPRLCSAISG